jgi:hypothetical protein
LTKECVELNRDGGERGRGTREETGKIELDGGCGWWVVVWLACGW